VLDKLILDGFKKMSITLQRSKREVQFEKPRLPPNVGPGTYNAEINLKELRER
jgi:hypothetical protein